MNVLGCIVNILGGIILTAIGVGIIVVAPKLKYKEKDYSKYPVAIGTVYHTHDFIGDRWIVGFTIDESGKEVLGMDDIISQGTFFPNKYNIPKFGTKEKIYYWKYDSNSQFSINNQKIEYYIHFCNEDLYSLQKIKRKNGPIFAVILGLLFIVVGFIVFGRVLGFIIGMFG